MKVLRTSIAVISRRSSIKKPSEGPPSQGSPQTSPFKAQGDLSFDKRSKDQCKAAVSFLKTVTACTACGAKGHWIGDSACPKSSKKGAGCGRGKGSSVQKPKEGCRRSEPEETSSSYILCCTTASSLMMRPWRTLPPRPRITSLWLVNEDVPGLWVL